MIDLFHRGGVDIKWNGPFRFNSSSKYGEIVQLQSALNDDYNNVSGKTSMYHISEPIMGRFFSKTCATLFIFEQFSLIHSALQ